jgi:hypothetical protein
MEELLTAVVSCAPLRDSRTRPPAELVAGHETEVRSCSRRLAVLSGIVRSRYSTTTNEDIEDRKFSVCSNDLSGLENREYYRRDESRRPRDTLYPQKLTLTSPTSGGRSVGIVRSRTQATEYSLV